MKNYIFALLAAVMLTGLSTAANAQQVPANKTSIVAAFAVYNEDTCGHIGVLKHSISKKPEHGTIRIDYEQHRLESGKCVGKMGRYMVVRYTPNRGYRGKDKATVTFRYPEYDGGTNNRAKTYRLKLTVK